MKKTAVITGGASGIGRASAEWLARDGVNIVIADINMDGAEDCTQTIIGKTDVDAIAIKTDVSSVDDIQSLVGQTMNRFSSIDILINCAADLSQVPLDLCVVETDFSVWDRVYQANFKSVVATCKFTIPHMIEAGGGSIVNISSVTSKQGDMERAAYSSLKAATNQLSRSIAARYGKDNIRCNTVSPGLILNNDASLQPPEEMKQGFRDVILSPELGLASDAAELIGFLATDRSKYITGEDIVIDGGFSKRVPYYFSLTGRSY